MGVSVASSGLGSGWLRGLIGDSRRTGGVNPMSPTRGVQMVSDHGGCPWFMAFRARIPPGVRLEG